MRQLKSYLRRLVKSTGFEPYARLVWKNVLRQKTKNDSYDRQTIAIMQKVLLSQSNCVDVGCHQGAFLDHMLRLAPQGNHYAFEPLPNLVRELRKKYAHCSRVTVSDVALSNSSGRSTFHYNRDHPAYSGIRRRSYPSEGDRVEVIEVRTARFDAVIPVDRNVDFIKVDVEGAELSVLEGACEHLGRYRPVVVFEHGLEALRQYDTRPGEVFDLLEQCRLKVSLLGDYLSGGRPLAREEMVHQVEGEFNFYFVAHP